MNSLSMNVQCKFNCYENLQSCYEQLQISMKFVRMLARILEGVRLIAWAVWLAGWLAGWLAAGWLAVWLAGQSDSCRRIPTMRVVSRNSNNKNRVTANH